MLASQVEQQQGDAEKKPLSISEALDVAKGSLEKLKLRVLGEVSEVNVKPGYANAYFTLKDETGTLPCQMWHDRFEKCGITLEVGMMVELVGRFSLYPKKGRMHFQVFAISVAGEGMLRQQVAMLQRKLEAEGLMAPERKVPVPAYPMKIGVVTSPRGDAIHDVLRTTRRRFPLAHIYVAGVPVEGARAPEYIVEGMRACFRARVEVILLVRGGGSYEDLMPFNDEQLARAIVKCLPAPPKRSPCKHRNSQPSCDRWGSISRSVSSSESSMQHFRSTDTPRDPYSKTLGRCSQATLSRST